MAALPAACAHALSRCRIFVNSPLLTAPGVSVPVCLMRCNLVGTLATTVTLSRTYPCDCARFSAWPGEALASVATHLLADTEVTPSSALVGKEASPEAAHQAAVSFLCGTHQHLQVTTQQTNGARDPYTLSGGGADAPPGSSGASATLRTHVTPRRYWPR